MIHIRRHTHVDVWLQNKLISPRDWKVTQLQLEYLVVYTNKSLQ